MDEAHEWTDERIAEIERRFADVYDQAAEEMRKKVDALLKQHDEERREWEERVSSGKATHDQYEAWLKDSALDTAFVNGMADVLAQDATMTDQLARDYVNDEIPQVYATNANFAAYDVERGIGWETHAFDLYDQSTVRRLIAEQPNLVPMAEIDGRADYRWNRQKMASAIVQSILQGESIPATAKRLESVLGMDKRASVKAARTAMTAAENAGRIDSYERARRMGIDIEQQWLATFDERTRITHRLLHGQHVQVGEKFVPEGYGERYSIRYPADPTAIGEMVWNCRCTLRPWTQEIEDAEDDLWTDFEDGTTFDEWRQGRKHETEHEEESPTVAGVKRGEPMTFERANERRGNPNYDIADRAGDRYLAANRRVNDYVRTHGYDNSEELERLRNERDATRDEYYALLSEQEQYRVNCQTCVVANEARRRGYDVEATGNPRSGSSTQEKVARDTSLAWIDPDTGEKPSYIRYDGRGRADVLGMPIPTRASYWRWLNEDGRIKEGERYTIEFEWSGRSHDGHIVCLERIADGLRLYDPQTGSIRMNDEIRDYLGNVKYSRTSYGSRYAWGPDLLRVDRLDFNQEIADEILRGTQ